MLPTLYFFICPHIGLLSLVPVRSWSGEGSAGEGRGMIFHYWWERGDHCLKKDPTSWVSWCLHASMLEPGPAGVKGRFNGAFRLCLASLGTERVFATSPCKTRTTIEEILLNLIMTGKEETKRTVLVGSRKRADHLNCKSIVLIFFIYKFFFVFSFLFFLVCMQRLYKQTYPECCYKQAQMSM